MKKDELLMLSTEEYSDQEHAGPFKVLRDFDLHEVAATVEKLPSTHGWRDKAGPEDVIDYLTREGFIAEVSCKKVHLGSYGDIHLTGDVE